jgi:DNA primase
VSGRDTIGRIREQTSIVDVVGESVKLHKQGQSYVGRCPFHREKTPSLHVNPHRGLFYCLGCGAFGDVFRFVEQRDGLSRPQAVRQLAERAGIALDETPEQRAAQQRRQALFQAGAVAADFFERMLREHPLREPAVAELLRRGLSSTSPTDAVADTLQAFRIGYAPYGWETLTAHLLHSGVSVQAAEAVGLLAPRRSGVGHYDRFRHRLMFAVLDLQGRVVAFSGRALAEPTAKQLQAAGLDPMSSGGATEARAKYINSPESPVYRKRDTLFGLDQARQHIRERQECIVVEGNFDVVSLHARGIKHVVAPLGTAFTVEQARLIKRFAPQAVFMFDPDAAGRRAVAAARQTCQEAGLVALVATVPAGMDPDELVRSGGADAVREVVQTARGILEHLIDSILEGGFPADDAQTKAAKIREVAELLGSEQDAAARAMAGRHVDRVAERLGIADSRSMRELAATVRKALAASQQALRPDPSRATRNLDPAGSKDPAYRVGREIFGAFLDYPELLGTELLSEARQLVDADLTQAIDAARQSWDKEKGLDLQQLLAKLGSPIHPFAAARLAVPRYENLDEARTKLLENVGKLKRIQLRCSSSEVEALQRAAASGDFGQEIALLREHERRAKKRHGL